MQTGVFVGKLAFMNDESRLKLPCQDLRDDLVKGNYCGLDLESKQLQGQVSGGQGSWNGHPHALEFFQSEGPGTHRPGTVFVSDAAHESQQGVSHTSIG